MQSEAAGGIEHIPHLMAGCMLSCSRCIAVATMLTTEQYIFGREEHRSQTNEKQTTFHVHSNDSPDKRPLTHHDEP